MPPAPKHNSVPRQRFPRRPGRLKEGRAARIGCPTSPPPRADPCAPALRAPPHGLLTRLATKPDEKCELSTVQIAADIRSSEARHARVPASRAHGQAAGDRRELVARANAAGSEARFEDAPHGRHE